LIAGAWVSGDSGQSQDVTDARGHFELVLRKSKSHDLTARWRYSDESRGKPDAQVEGSAHGVRIVLAASAALSGRVTLDGKPVASYALLVSPVPDSHDANGIPVRAADGRFEKRDLRAGKWKVTVAAHGCDVASTAEVLVEPGNSIDVGDIVLRRGRRISGHVFDATGAGVAGARVTIGWPSDSDASVQTLLEGRAETITDASGAFALDGVARTSIYPRLPIRASHPLLGTSPERELIDVDASVDFVLAPTGGIDGVIDGFRGDQTHLDARRQDGEGAGGARIDRAGGFHFDQLPPGTYTIRQSMAGDSARLSPITATVVAFQRTKVHATIEVNTVTLLARVVTAACNEVVVITASNDSGEHVGSVSCSGEVTTLRYFPPGEYRACDWSQHCTSITVPSTPPTQSLEIRLGNSSPPK